MLLAAVGWVQQAQMQAQASILCRSGVNNDATTCSMPSRCTMPLQPLAPCRSAVDVGQPLVNPWSTSGQPLVNTWKSWLLLCTKSMHNSLHGYGHYMFQSCSGLSTPWPTGVLRLPTCRAGDLKLSFVPTCRISRRYRMNSRRLNWLGTGSRIQVCKHQKTALMTTNGMV